MDTEFELVFRIMGWEMIGTDMNRHKGGLIFTIVDQNNKDDLLRTADN